MSQGRRETEKHETGNRRMGQTEKTTETQRHRVTKKKEKPLRFLKPERF